MTGLWLLQESLRSWGSPDLDPLLTTAAREEPRRFIIDADDPVFLPPGDMPSRIVSWLSSRGLPAPSGPGQIVRCIRDRPCALLLDEAAADDSHQHSQVIFEPELVIRQSTVPAGRNSRPRARHSEPDTAVVPAAPRSPAGAAGCVIAL